MTSTRETLEPDSGLESSVPGGEGEEEKEPDEVKQC